VLPYRHRLHPSLPAICARSSRDLDVVHLARGLVIVLVKARHRGQVIVVFALGPGLVRRILAGKSCDVFWHGVLVAAHVAVGSSGNSTFDLGIVARGISHEEGRGLAVEGVGRVRVAEELREEDLEDIDHVKHGRPGLVDNIEAHGPGPSIHVLDTILEETSQERAPPSDAYGPRRALGRWSGSTAEIRFDSGDSGFAASQRSSADCLARLVRTGVLPGPTYNSSMFGWKMRFMNPILGDLYGYVSGSSTCTFQMPPSNGAMMVSVSSRRRAGVGCSGGGH
jgi:hypothetical protein